MLKSDQNVGSMTAAELCELMKQCCCKDSGSTNSCDYCCDELTESFYCAAHPEWNNFCDAFQAMQSNISAAFPINGQPTVYCA